MTPRHANKFMFFLMLYQMVSSILVMLAFFILRDGFEFNIHYKALLITSQIVSFVIPFFIYLAIKRCKIRDVLDLKRISLTNIILITLLMIFVQPMMMFLSAVSTLFFPNNVSTVIEMLFTGSLPLLILTIAVTPAICEEIIFRGVIASGYKKIDLKTACLVNGFLFGIMHRDPQQFLYAFILGSVFYLFLHYTSSIFAPILAHFVVNGSQAFLAHSVLSMEYYQQYAYSMPDIDVSIFEGNETIMAIIFTAILSVVALPFFIWIFSYFVKHNKAKGNLLHMSDDLEFDLDIRDSVTNQPYNAEEEGKEEGAHKVVDIYLILTVVLFIVSLIIF